MLDDSPESWFDRVSAEPRLSERPSALPRAERAGDPLSATLGGTFAGAAGGVLFLAVSLATWAIEPRTLAVAAAGGALVGAMFGRVSRRLLRVVPRIVLGGVLFGALWILIDAFVLMRLAPGSAPSLPFATAMLGACVYGVCVGAVPPMRVRMERGRRL